jgi:hypothetical protein
VFDGAPLRICAPQDQEQSNFERWKILPTEGDIKGAAFMLSVKISDAEFRVGLLGRDHRFFVLIYLLHLFLLIQFNYCNYSNLD